MFPQYARPRLPISPRRRTAAHEISPDIRQTEFPRWRNPAQSWKTTSETDVWMRVLAQSPETNEVLATL